MALPHIPDDELLRLPITELLARWPEAVQILLDLRMACVGCDFGSFDTVAEALEVHGLTAATFLAQLRPALRIAGPHPPSAIEGGPR